MLIQQAPDFRKKSYKTYEHLRKFLGKVMKVRIFYKKNLKKT